MEVEDTNRVDVVVQPLSVPSRSFCHCQDILKHVHEDITGWVSFGLTRRRHGIADAPVVRSSFSRV